MYWKCDFYKWFVVIQILIHNNVVHSVVNWLYGKERRVRKIIGRIRNSFPFEHFSLRMFPKKQHYAAPPSSFPTSPHDKNHCRGRQFTNAKSISNQNSPWHAMWFNSSALFTPSTIKEVCCSIKEDGKKQHTMRSGPTPLKLRIIFIALIDSDSTDQTTILGCVCNRESQTRKIANTDTWRSFESAAALKALPVSPLMATPRSWRSRCHYGLNSLIWIRISESEQYWMTTLKIFRKTST